MLVLSEGITFVSPCLLLRILIWLLYSCITVFIASCCSPPYTRVLFLYESLNIIFHIHLCLPYGFSPSVLSTGNLHLFHACYVLRFYSLFDNLLIFCADYNVYPLSISSSLCTWLCHQITFYFYHILSLAPCSQTPSFSIEIVVYIDC